MPSEPGGAPQPWPAQPVALAEAVLVRPQWPAPPGVGALMTTRGGGVSTGAWASLNLGLSVGDSAPAVAENRRRFAASLRRADAAGARAAGMAGTPPAAMAGTHPAAMAGMHPPPLAGAAARPVWLKQVHGAQVIELDAFSPEHVPMAADAAWTCTPGVACVVGAADCLPVLLAARGGGAVAAAHAGWRGLAAGVLDNTVRALQDGVQARPADLLAWLGPCIGPRQFEVGADVLQAFGHEPAAATFPHFAFRPRADGSMRWLADLQGLARARLQALGVQAIHAEAACTHEDASRFFSFRRDGRGGGASGRMAAAIWIER